MKKHSFIFYFLVFLSLDRAAWCDEPAYSFSTLAGSPMHGSTDGTGSTARFNNQGGIAIDGGGNIYVADTSNHTIRKITPAGMVSTLAGVAGTPGESNGIGPAARFTYPTSVAVDGLGNVYVTEDRTIRKISPDAVVSTLAGSNTTPEGLGYGVQQYGSADGTGAAALFHSPNGLAVDGAGNVYVADTGNSTVRKITPNGVVSTLAGLARQSGHADGTGAAARFFSPSGVALDNAGNAYVADADTIRKITAGGVVTTLAGTGYVGSMDGPGVAAQFFSPVSLAVDNNGNVYVADANNFTIRKISPGGVVTTLAGMPLALGSADGSGSSARFRELRGTAVDSAGNIFVSDTGNETIRKITPGGIVATVAGRASTGSADAVGAQAGFYNPYGIAVDFSGNVYVADTDNHKIRKVTPSGVVTTLVYTSPTGGGTINLNSPSGVAVNDAGNVYVADTNNDTIRIITPGGIITTLAGVMGTFGSSDGRRDQALFNAPHGLAVDKLSNVYVADMGNSVIRKIAPDGTVTTIAGMAGMAGNADGIGSAARFNFPRSVALDGSGNIYVADGYNNTVRKITPTGVVTTLAGAAVPSGSLADGKGPVARFNFPSGVAVDSSGNVYVADAANNAIRRITPEGLVTTIAGAARTEGSTDGLSDTVQFNYPNAIAIDSAGNVYVADTSNNTIRKGMPLAEIITQPRSQTATVGANTTFTVVVSGVPAPTFQWLKNGVPVSAATSATYTIPYLQLSDAASYTVVISNGTAATVSNPASLVVNAATYVVGFDALGYLSHNPDVAAAFGSDLNAAWQHYLNYGINEGRVFDDLFRVDEYLLLYPDLQAAFGTDRRAAVLHWLNYGRAEGRLGRVPPTFDIGLYLGRYPDLQAAFGSLPVARRNVAVWNHYLDFGVYEGRSDGDFDVRGYLAQYGDLQTAFGLNLEAASLHWYIHGRYEGRRIPAGFDVHGYLARYPDIVADYTYGSGVTPDLYGAWLHYWNYGLNEGRVYDELFRVDEYLALYADLRAAFGTDRQSALLHWLYYGRAEGRSGRFNL